MTLLHPSTHLAFSTVSVNFKLWKYFCMALACCRWYSIVTPLRQPDGTGSTGRRGQFGEMRQAHEAASTPLPLMLPAGLHG